MTTDGDGRNTTVALNLGKYKESSIKSLKSIESIAEALSRAESWEGPKVESIDRVDRYLPQIDCQRSTRSISGSKRVEKVGAHAAFWENLWAKAGPNRASIDSSEKRIMLDYQLTVVLVKVVRIRFSLKIPSQYKTYTWGYTWRTLACYPFINIKLAAYHFCCFM